MTIPALPALDRASATFKTDVDNFFTTQLPAFSVAIEPEIERINAIGYGSYNATSTTSLTVGTGSKSLTVETGRGYVVGQAVLVANTANPANYMAGQVTSYNSGTGALVVNVTSSAGSGTLAAWTVSITALAGGGGSAVGDIMVSESPPGGAWLPCNGAIYLQSAYPALYAKLGTRYQNYSGPTTAAGNVAKAPYAVNWLNGQFVAVSTTTTDTTQFYTSPDAVTWTGRTAPQASNLWVDVTYGSGYYVALSNGGGANRIARSADGVTWTSSAGAPDANGWISIATNGSGVFVAVSSDGTNRVTRSVNAGANWSSVSVPARQWQKVIWTGQKFVAFQDGYSMSSTDGTTWVESAIAGLNGLNPIDSARIVWTGKEFVSKLAWHPLGLATSADGINFYPLQPGIPLDLVTAISSMLYANGTLFVSATTSSGGMNLFITHDLKTWAVSFENAPATAGNGKLALSTTGIFLSLGTSGSRYRGCNYTTTTQFVVPNIGSKSYIKAE